MAITGPNDNNVSGGFTNNDNMTINQPAAAAAPQQQQAQQGRWSYHTGGLFRAPLGRNPGSEILKKMQDEIVKLYETADQTYEYTVIPLDNNNEKALAYSVLVVCARAKTNSKLGASFHSIIIEDSGEKLAPIFENINNYQVEIIRPASVAYNEYLMKEVIKKVSQAFPGVPLFNAEATVVPSGFNIEDKKSMHALAANAALATATELAVRNTNFVDLNLANNAHDSSLLVRLAFDKKTVSDAVGQPMRSDFEINFQSQLNGAGQNQAPNNGERTTKVATLNGFIDLVWAPAQEMMGMGQYMLTPQQQMLAKQKYVARAVLTNVECDYLNTLPSLLMALVPMMSIRDNNNWYNAFKPRHYNDGKVDMYDIGALNYEANLENNPNGLGDFIDTKSESFTIEKVAQLLASTIRPGLVYSMDVPDCGPQTWYTSVFAAAQNQTNGQDAANAIYNAAMQVTNGKFKDFMPQGAKIFSDNGDRVHLGHYEDSEGILRDIRDFDYLAILNRMNGDHEAIKTWSDSFTQPQIPIARRLSDRKRIIMSIAKRAEFTGFATRVTFTTDFVIALAAACAAAGMTTRIDTGMIGTSFNSDRGVAGFVSGGLVPFGQTNVFNNATAGAGVGNNYQGSYNRWGG